MGMWGSGRIRGRGRRRGGRVFGRGILRCNRGRAVLEVRDVREAATINVGGKLVE